MKKIKIFRLVFIALIAILINSCNDKDEPVEQEPNPLPKIPFAKGADVGWLPQMEATGYKFYDADGTPKDCLQLLKDRGINTVRLRVFVNPSDDKVKGHCSKDETVAMAVRAKKMGMQIMIDFHYSDSFADPGHQAKPKAWENHTFTQLLDDVYNHTYDVLSALKTAGITPEWVQIGNEIIAGMLWDDGKFENWGQLQQLLDKGYEATKAINKSIRVIIHTEGYEKILWFFGKAKANNLRYDVIGVSFYPSIVNKSTPEELVSTLKKAVARYNKEVMVVEIGDDYNIDTEEKTKNMLIEVINGVRGIPNDMGLGVIYWEPQGEKSWSGYEKSAWRPDGKPSTALDAFKI